MYLPWLRNYNFLIFEKIDSTNSEAVRLVKSGISGNFVILASSQTMGRGRRGKQWCSAAGNLYVSLLLDKNILIEKQPQLSFVTALAAYETIKYLAKKSKIILDIKLKWPNDILINGKKVAGILLESLNFEQKNYLIIGLGINIKASPQNIDQLTTNLTMEGIAEGNLIELLNIFMHYFEQYFLDWHHQGFSKFRHNWLKKAYKLKKQITIDNGRTRVSGIFQDLDFDGSIIVKDNYGLVHNLSAGEVFFDNNS